MKVKGAKELPSFLTDEQIREIKSDIESQERMLKNPDTKKYIQTPGEVVQEINQKKKILEKHAPERLTGEKANKAYAMAKKLAVWINENMPSQKEHTKWYPKNGDSYEKEQDFNSAVQHQVQWMKHGGDAVKAYRYIMRRLDPSNPNVENIERLRRRG